MYVQSTFICARHGLKNSRKRKPCFTIKSQKWAYYTRGKGARTESNSQVLKHPLWADSRIGAYASLIRLSLPSLPFWAYTHVLGMLREQNRDITGIGRGTLLLYLMNVTCLKRTNWENFKNSLRLVLKRGAIPIDSGLIFPSLVPF